MSQKNPECPLYNPLNCKEYCNPKVCAFVKKDRICLKKRKPETQSKPAPEFSESPCPVTLTPEENAENHNG